MKRIILPNILMTQTVRVQLKKQQISIISAVNTPCNEKYH